VGEAQGPGDGNGPWQPGWQWARRSEARLVGYIKLAGALLGLALSAMPRADTEYTGLWVSDVVIERINRPGPASATWDTTTNLVAANPFHLRAILHVDTNGQARLLQRVLLAYSLTTEVTNPVTHQVTTNGAYRLLSDESLVATVRQTDPQARITRLSSVNFPLMAPQTLNGQFGPGQALVGTVTVPYDDPVNPFVHVYAPLHDNLRIQNAVTNKLLNGAESYTITRSLTFDFDDPLPPTSPRSGVDEIAGDFRETIEGLYRPVQVQGRFRMQRLTTIGQLD